MTDTASAAVAVTPVHRALQAVGRALVRTVAVASIVLGVAGALAGVGMAGWVIGTVLAGAYATGAPLFGLAVTGVAACAGVGAVSGWATRAVIRNGVALLDSTRDHLTI